MDFTITRAKVTIASVNVANHDSMAIVTVSQFGYTTDAEFADAAKQVQAMRPRGIVLDLRNNPGGLLTGAITMLGYFLPNNSLAVMAQYRDPAKIDEYRTSGDPVFKGLPVVVLVNKGSASAAEIVAAALQDSYGATVVGQTSFGKGTVQQLEAFSDGSSLKMTIAHWLSPKKQPIQGHGVTPDIAIAADSTGKTDPQMNKALDILKGKAGM